MLRKIRPTGSNTASFWEYAVVWLHALKNSGAAQVAVS